MSWKCEKIIDNPLRPAFSEEEYPLHMAALEWSLADCIVIQTRKDLQSEATWRDRLEPFHHQVQNLFTFCRRLPVTLLADDVGLGKTISAGLILSELMARRRVSRALVLCPKILCAQWVEELDAKFGIQGRAAYGKDLQGELAGGFPVVVTTYESATDRLAEIRSGAFDMLVLDEAHKLRNLHGGNEPPKMATAVRDALQKRLFKFVVMLTATPIQNRIWDLYSLFDCLTVAKGHRNPLGTPEQFEQQYLLPCSKGRRLNPYNAEAFRRILRQYVVRTRRGDANLQFPTREVRLVRVPLSPQERELPRLVEGHLAGLDRLQQISLARAMMSSPQAFATQLENMAERQPSLKAAAQQARILADDCVEPAKLCRLLHLCDELKAERPSDWRLVVFTHRKETQATIGKALGRKGISVGFIRGGEARQNEQSIEQLRANPPGVHVLVSTDAGAEGVNLQVANVLVNYDLPWNPMVVEQRIGRLQRLASEHANVLICNFVAAGSVEELVVARLMEKLQGIAQAIGDIESILESPEWNGNEASFEEQIRDLVVKSLLGQDIQQATLLAQESIERASRMIEEQREVIDQTLGRLDELHHSGPTMPRLERSNPTIPADDFVLRAKRAEGATVRELSPGLFEITGGLNEVVAFDEAKAQSSTAVFMGNVRLYQPGKPEFERLVQRWVDRCGHHVCDLRGKTDADTERLARAWCEKTPEVRFLGCQVMERESKFQGLVRVRVKASNGVDAYEKLICGQFHPQGHQTVLPSKGPSDLVTGEARLSQIQPGSLAPLARVVEADHDVGEFCRFYEARRAEELAAAGDDPRLRHKVSEDFTPCVVGDIVGFQGVRYDEVRLLVRFSVKGEGDYEATLRALPASGQVLEEPATKPCGHTRLRVPAGCLEPCQLTGKLILRHMLATSELSGRRGLRERMVACQVTGKKVFDDEAARSSVSGRVAVKSAFVNCQQTGCLLLQSEVAKSASGRIVRRDLLSPSEKPPGRLGLADEFGWCEKTEKRLLLDELGRSAVSGKLVDREFLYPSASSGRLALAEELVTCEESRVSLLPDERGRCVETGKLVDARLLVICERPRGHILLSLAGKSDYSGKIVLRNFLLQSQKPPGRLGLADEFGRCEKTEKRLLLDELGKSAVSGKLVDKALLVQSARSKKIALVEEMVVCDLTQKHLLPNETACCSVTGKRVDTRLLATSEYSGRVALTRLMQRCATTNKLALKTELEQCQLSAQLVLPSELRTCVVTNKRGVHSRMARSDVTGDYAVPEQAFRSPLSGKVCLLVKAESVLCAWLEQPILRSEAKGCTLTAKMVAESLLNDQGELIPFRDLMNGQARNAVPSDDLIPRIRQLDESFFSGLKHIWVLESPKGGKLAVCAQINSWLGLNVRYVGFLLKVPTFEITGQGVIGYRDRQGWILEQKLMFP